jgi:hypothetical protein
MAGALVVPSARAGWRRHSIPVLVLAQIGAVLLVVVAVNQWPVAHDEQAYWSAAERLVNGEALYSPLAAPNGGGTYWYPPVLAQVLAPLTLILSDAMFRVLWTLLLLACVWILAGRSVIVALACVAFLPVALELSSKNAHLVIALLIVLALRRSWVFWIPAAALKLAPVLGVAYLLSAGRWREAGLVLGFGAVVAVASFLLAPSAWAEFVAVAMVRAPSDAGTFVPLPPYPFRLGVGLLIAFLSGRRGGRAGEVGLVIAITFAGPTLWANAFSQLLAILPLLRMKDAARGLNGAEPLVVGTRDPSVIPG